MQHDKLYDYPYVEILHPKFRKVFLQTKPWTKVHGFTNVADQLPKRLSQSRAAFFMW